MEIATKHFGNVNIDESKVITFEEGIFGFKDVKKFILLYDQGEEGGALVWLQAVEAPETCLPLVNPMNWFTDYAPEVDDELIASIGDLDPNVLDVFTVVVIPETIEAMTTNLKAPILINRQTKKGRQVVANDDAYEVRHNLYEQMKIMTKGGE
jgi:flagellar assembly factor FliW